MEMESGRCRVCDVMCTLSIHTLSNQYLCNDDITPERKRPFCRFLVWVYLSTNSEAAVQLNLYST